ncbi:hypothetical protein FCL40_15780 [Ferrimonas sediminicola]|uniref:Rap1a immunity protein domain-containing protein n=1 Tax=Ferrimonas sediminicola TaxID=2569538 RepID=A0A4U1B992_9GAMM|nr:hypothetical protein [Ferrimonas sediminicola]TKB47310.1 hypothetical protein FCL40_15780 [Ferrimonas sediminicola]
MRRIVAIAALMVSPALWANDINLAQCQEAPRSDACLYYLQGAVDGALALSASRGATSLPAGTFSERALKYRGGKRFKQANDAICRQNTPQRDQMVLALDDLAAEGMITSQEELSQALSELLTCPN